MMDHGRMLLNKSLLNKSFSDILIIPYGSRGHDVPNALALLAFDRSVSFFQMHKNNFPICCMITTFVFCLFCKLLSILTHASNWMSYFYWSCLQNNVDHTSYKVKPSSRALDLLRKAINLSTISIITNVSGTNNLLQYLLLLLLDSSTRSI
jgi:hypothetical protein